jgi:hypothetical protein
MKHRLREVELAAARAPMTFRASARLTEKRERKARVPENTVAAHGRGEEFRAVRHVEYENGGSRA